MKYLCLLLLLLIAMGCAYAPSKEAKMADDVQMAVEVGGGESTSDSAKKAPRIRQYFPETLLFAPNIITDEKGMAQIELPMADSITTWRLTASANTQNGLLGSTTASLRVFQDFFVDIDFPVALTQNDEVAVPVAIYNYLPTSQKVRLVVTPQSWFTLLDKAEKNIVIKAKDIAVVYFRLRAKNVGYHQLTVMAYGEKMSDAVRRGVEIIPDGKKIEKVINGQLTQSQQHQIDIPKNCIPNASKIIVKCYPGIESSLVEGLDGMLALPNG